MTFEELLQDPNVLYVYETGLQIYGLFEGVDRREFLVIHNDGLKPEIESTREKEYSFKRISDWFQEVMSGGMLPWMCACLNKKFIHKEHVKLMMHTDPLQLRKDFDKYQNFIWTEVEDAIKNNAPFTAEKLAWGLYRYLAFANQIIDNHKIINFKTVAPAYNKLVQGLTTDIDTLKSEWYTIAKGELELFTKRTDELLKSEKIRKILKNENI